MQKRNLENAAKISGLDYETVKGIAKKGIPLGNFQSTDDVVSLVSYMASEDGKMMTGQCVMINAGKHMS